MIFSKTFLSASALVAFAAIALPGVASAQEVHNRVGNQQQRIDRGVANGQLTNREYNSDERRLERINAQRERDLANNGGHLTRREDVHLNRELNGNSRDIYFTKHNLRHQPGAPTR